MTLKHHKERTIKSVRSLLTKYNYIVPAVMLLAGFLLGATFIKTTTAESQSKPKTPDTITFLMHDGAVTRNWNGVSLVEGESVASIVDRIARTENVGLSWSGTGRDRQITSLAGKDVGTNVWHVYINNTALPTLIGKFYPRPGDAITLIYSPK